MQLARVFKSTSDKKATARLAFLNDLQLSHVAQFERLFSTANASNAIKTTRKQANAKGYLV